MKKVKIQNKLFWHIQVDLGGIWNNFVASVGGAYTSKDKMVRIWATFKKKLFFISALKSPTYRDFMP